MREAFLEHLVFFSEAHVFLVEVAVVEGELVDLFGVEAALVGNLLPFFEDAGVELFQLLLICAELVFIGLV